MHIENLIKGGGLKPHVPSPHETERLLAAVSRAVRDVHVDGISGEARFDAGYKAIIQCALLTLMASGFRPLTNVPGQHRTLIKSLEVTLGLPKDDCAVLEELRRKRDANDSTGDSIDDESMRECITRAELLTQSTRKWLADHHPELLPQRQ